MTECVYVTIYSTGFGILYAECLLYECIVCLILLFSVHTAEQVLDTFRDQFVKDMDAKAVVMDLLNEGIIDDGDLEQISSIPDPKQRNQRLHLCLKQKCTDDALNNVCDVIAGVKGNAKMKELGKAMKRTLESSECSCVCVCVQ